MSEKYNYEIFKLKADLCKTFSDPNRLIILNELGSGEKSVGELMNVLSIPQAVVSRHLALMRNKGVVKTRRQGTNVFYSLTDMKIIDACNMVHQVLMNHMERNRDLAEEMLS